MIVRFHSHHGVINNDYFEEKGKLIYEMLQVREVVKNVDKALETVFEYEMDYDDYNIWNDYNIDDIKKFEMIVSYEYKEYLIKERKRNEVEVKKKNEEDEKLKRLKKQAYEENKNILYKEWLEPCNDPKEECNLDKVYLYIMPNGEFKKERFHSY